MANKTIYPYGVGGQTASGIDIANDLETSSAVIALSARQGRVLKQAVEIVQSNVQNLHGALANMAFTELPKPTLSQLDWTGGTFYVTISKSLTGCTGSNNATQIAEGSSYINTITLYANHSLQSISVLMSGIDITSTAYDSSTGIISIASVTGNISITVVAVEVVVYKVNNHFINVSSSNSATQVEQGQNYSTVLSLANNAVSDNKDLRVFIGSEMMTAETDYTYDSSTGALSIPAAKITGDIDICKTASTGKITVTVRAGMSTTLKMYRDQWQAAFFDDTIDATNSADDVTVVIDNVPTYNYSGIGSLYTVSMWTVGTPAAIKSIDFGGCRTRGSGSTNKLSSFAGADTISGLSYVETPNNDAVVIGSFFYNCSNLQGSIDLMPWVCTTQTSIKDIINGCSFDDIILPYLPNIISLYGAFSGTSVKRIIFNKTGSIARFGQMFLGASGIEYIDMSLATVQLVNGSGSDYPWYETFKNSSLSGVTLKIGEFDVSDSAVSGALSFVDKLICTTATPPNSALLNCLDSNVQIYVPNSAVNAYKTAWSAMANNIHPVSEYTE